uniref:asparagine synthase (glutamine-hydrolyzing) n=1 Tax=viral metagenome TaxID=1070528 RepID=A0A6C0HM10_9ZZZZ
MCGIFALISNKSISNNTKIKKYALSMSAKLRHRGPDGTGYIQTNHGCFAHERLSIIDPNGGNQPLYYYSKDKNLILCVNGEIFNYKKLREQYNTYPYATGSDCESILALYEYNTTTTTTNTNTNTTNTTSTTIPGILIHTEIVALLGQLDGQFSFILHDTLTNMVFVARDPYGITQLYYGLDKYGNIHIASELKALVKCISIEVMPSGAYLYFNATHPIINPINYFAQTKGGSWLDSPGDLLACARAPIYNSSHPHPNNIQYSYAPQPILNADEETLLLEQIRNTLESAVAKRLMTDVPFGVCLSGGLDSSLIAAITMRYMRAHPEQYGANPQLHTFSIGIKDESTDLIYAREVAKHIGSIHHEIYFTPEEALNALDDVIYHTESADITTTRASICNYLLARKIQSFGIKMVLSGEGADEILGGYLYFHQAPNDKEHQLECKMRVMDLGYFDCLRTDKSLLANSVEGRYPFLDVNFVKLCININKDVKCQKGIEKYILRKAFDLKDNSGRQIYLPESVLYRQKCQFSNCGSNHCETLKQYAESEVTDKFLIAYENRTILYPVNTPPTMEAFYYRQIFESMFPGHGNVYKYWIPNTSWANVSADPSGLCQTSYRANEQYLNV